MSWLLDTSVIVHLIERNPSVLENVSQLAGDLVISAVTKVELEGGVVRNPAIAAARRQLLDEVLKSFEVLPFGDAAAICYGQIVTATGFSRRRVIDRMIGAHALAGNATLVTMNASDFRDIPGLALLAW